MTCCPRGGARGPSLLRTWVGYLLTILAGVMAYATAFASIEIGVIVGWLAIVGWLFVGTGAYRYLKAVAADHAEAVARF